MAFRSRSNLRVLLNRGHKRAVAWSLGPEGTSSFSSSGSVVVPTGTQALLNDTTIVRVRGVLTIFLQSASAALDGFVGAFGLAIANENAFNAGIASMNILITDANWNGWLYHTFYQLKAAIGPIADNEPSYPGNQSVRIEVDSKAMRKIKLGDVLYGAYEHTETGTAVLGARFDSRILFKLS